MVKLFKFVQKTKVKNKMTLQKQSYHRNLLLLGAILGFLAVIFGAYGAHGLKGSISAENIEIFETGVRFQMYHALFALIVGTLGFIPKKARNLIFYFLLFGVLLFSGSIYGLATNGLTSFDFTSIALFTPLGGLFLIVSWGLLIANLLKIKTI